MRLHFEKPSLNREEWFPGRKEKKIKVIENPSRFFHAFWPFTEPRGTIAALSPSWGCPHRYPHSFNDGVDEALFS